MSMLSPNEEVDMSMGGSDRNNPNDIRWHLDRKIPIALLVALFFQSCAAMWWAASTNTRVDQLERGQINAYTKLNVLLDWKPRWIPSSLR